MDTAKLQKSALEAKSEPTVSSTNRGATVRQWTLLFLIAAIWGSSFILIKRGLFTVDGQKLFSPIQVGALRIVIAALFMVPLVIKKLSPLKNGKIKFLLLVGLFGNGIPAFLFAMAQTEIPSALAGMLNALVPVFSMLIALVVFGVAIRRFQILGVGIGLSGATGLVLGAGGIEGGDINLWYAGLIVLATICYAISLNVIKQFLQNESSVAITGIALIMVSPAGLAVLIASDFFAVLANVEGAPMGLAAIALLAVLGTAIALIVFNKLVQETNTVFASSVTYLIPLVAIGWGLADGESLNLWQGLSALVMLGGIFLINRG